ncbi:MAG: T9SS type A sorting domain-containing protein, partial [Bacteroidota bacterium]
EAFPDFATSISGETQVCDSKTTNLTANGGENYVWSNGATSSTIEVGSGNYSVTITSENGCEKVETVSVEAFPDFATSISGETQVCDSKTTNLTANGGENYVWSNGSRSASIEVGSGNYSVTITSENGCEKVETVSVEAFPNFETSISGQTQVCGSETTNLTANGGENYVWSNGETSESIEVSSGSYSVTITNENGCEKVETVSVAEVAQPSFQVVQNATCLDSRDFYELEILVDQEDITIEVSTFNNIVQVQGRRVLITQILISEDITITITNAAGCSFSQTIQAPDCACPALAAPISGGDQTICEGDDLPMLSVENVPDGFGIDWYTTPVGGSAIAMNTLNFQPESAGTYYAELVETASNCVSRQRAAVTLTINPLPELTVVDVTNINCDQLTGTATVIATGDNPPFRYQIENSAFQTATTFSDLAAGTYTILVEDNANCSTTTLVTITENTRVDRTELTQFTCDANEAGIDSTLLINELGCDSTVVTITVNGSSPIERRQLFTCNADEIGTDSLRFQNQFDCDSLIIVERILATSDTTFLFATTCEPTQAGTSTRLFLNEFGCDSIVVTRTDLAEVSAVRFTDFVCDPMQVSIDTSFFVSEFGCDSLVISERILQGISDTTRLQEITCDFTQVGLDTMILSNETGCDSLVITERIFAFPPPPVLTPNINIQEFCEGDSLVLMTDTYEEGLQWVKDNEDLFDEIGRSLVIKESGQYGVSYTNDDGCTVVSEIITVNVIPLPAEPIIENNGLNELVIINAEVYAEDVTILWYFDNELLDNDNELSYCADTTGTYTVVVADGSGRCSSQAALFFERDTTIENCIVSTQEELKRTSIEVFPNPTNGLLQLKIQTLNQEQVYIIIYDNYGRVVSRINTQLIFEKQVIDIDLTNCPSGTYWIQVIGENIQTTRKVIKL